MLNIFIGIFAFIIGAFLGSFCTLAVYRIPLKQDITHERSYCVNCKHRLEFLDLIPILSYIFLRGKCRYCGQKIRPRYLLLEVFFGLTYMMFILSLNIDVLNISITSAFGTVFSTLYLVSLFLIAGIDKEYRNIHHSVLLLGILSQVVYMVYLYILDFNVYRYVIYLVFAFIFLCLSYRYYKKEKHNNYILQILSLLMFMCSFTNTYLMILTIILSLIYILGLKIIRKEKDITSIPIGFILCIFNILLLIIGNFIGLGVIIK